MYRIAEISIDQLKDNKMVIIYGASVGAKVVGSILRKYGIVFQICDRKKSGEVYDGSVVSKISIIEQKPEAIVLVVGTRSFDSQCAFLEKINHKHYYSVCDLLSLYDEPKDELPVFERVAINDFINKYRIYATRSSEELILHTVDVLVTERCSLQCKNCSALIPDYVHPKEYDINEIINNCKQLLRYVDYIIELVIVGGEPLLHKELYKFLEWGNGESKIGRITIISNATILPNEKLCDNLVGTKSYLRLSDYGSLSYKLKEISELAKKKNLNMFIQRLDEWQDMGGTNKRNYPMIEKKHIFRDCPFSFSTFLLEGKLFRCGHAAHLHNLQYVSCENDYVDIFENSSTVKEDIKKYLDDKEFLEACDYCNGVGKDAKGILQAIQCDGRKPVYINE